MQERYMGGPPRDRMMHERNVNSFGELLQICRDRVANGHDYLGNASLEPETRNRAGDLFYGTDSLQEAIDLAEFGWDEGLTRAREIAATVNPRKIVTQTVPQLDTEHHFSGQQVNVERFVSGNPRNMMRRAYQQEKPNKMLDFIASVGYLSDVEQETIIERGVAIASAMQALRTTGHSVGLTTVRRVENRYGEQFQQTTRVLRPGGSFSLNAVLFATSHPSYLRRMMFALSETESEAVRKKFGFHGSGYYSSSQDIKGYEHPIPALVVRKEQGTYLKRPEEVEGYASLLVNRAHRRLAVAE